MTGREIGEYYRKKQLEKRDQQNFGHQQYETQAVAEGSASHVSSRWCKNRNSLEQNHKSLNPLHRDKIEIDKDSLQEILTSISRHSCSDYDGDSAGTSSGLLKSYQQNLQRNSTSDGKLLFDGPTEIWPIGEWNSMDLGKEYSQKSQPEKSKLFAFRKGLPAFQKQHDIMQLINDHPVVVIDGDTGCGKLLNSIFNI